jgi:hypothetical protein
VIFFEYILERSFGKYSNTIARESKLFGSTGGII